MSKQQAYTSQLKGYSGQREGSGHQAASGVNDTGSAAQVDDITVSTAVDSTAYQFEVDGVVVTFTSGTGTTKPLIVAGLITAMRGIQELEDVATANPSGTDVIRLTAVTPGTGYTLTESDANLATAVVTANGTTQDIKFGRAVVRRTGGNSTVQSAALPSAASQEFLGVNERIQSDVNPTGSPKNATAPFKMMSLVHSGDMLVEVEEAVTAGDPVFFRHTAGAGGSTLGIFRNDADTASADQVTGAKFKSTTTGAGLAVIGLNGA